MKNIFIIMKIFIITIIFLIIEGISLLMKLINKGSNSSSSGSYYISGGSSIIFPK